MRIADRDVIAMLHLSGAYISGENFDAIKEDVLAFLQEQGVAVKMSNGLICTVAGRFRPLVFGHGW